MNPIIDRMVKNIRTALAPKEEVLGLVVYGSYARGRSDFLSDIDLIIYLTDRDGWEEEIKTCLRDIMNRAHGGIYWEYDQFDKWMLFAVENCTKLEIKIKEISGVEPDVIAVRSSQVATPADGILIDRTGRIMALYQRFWHDSRPAWAYVELLRATFKHFVYYFEEFMRHFNRGDMFRCSLYYHECIRSLGSLIAFARGERQQIPEPKFFQDILSRPPDISTAFFDLSMANEPFDMYARKEALIRLFLEYSDKAANEPDIQAETLPSLHQLFESLLRKYPPFYNCRDITQIINIYHSGTQIQAGCIYRSSSLVTIDPERVLSFLRQAGIKRILDLRGRIEKKKTPAGHAPEYSRKLEKYISSVPIEPLISYQIDADNYKNLYYTLIKDRSLEIKKIFTHFFAEATSRPMLIHCEAGKDRTGLLIALLFDFLGVDRAAIRADYLASYNGTRPEYLEFFFDVISREFGSTEAYLRGPCEITPRTLSHLKATLLADTAG